jgi:hypothetical protein
VQGGKKSKVLLLGAGAKKQGFVYWGLAVSDRAEIAVMSPTSAIRAKRIIVAPWMNQRCGTSAPLRSPPDGTIQ